MKNRVLEPRRSHASFQALLDLLLPRRCLGCTALLPTADPIADSGGNHPAESFCPACSPGGDWPPPPCPTCARAALALTPDGRPLRCEGCRDGEPSQPRVRLGEYEPPLRAMILAAKWGGGEDRIEPLAEWLARQIILAWGSPTPVEAIVPVPRSWSRRLRHGRPLAEDLAGELARILRRPLLPALRRRPGRPQTSQSASERRRIPRGAFHVAPRRRVGVSRTHVLLVDDVVTTGATLAACARALEGAGAASVRTAVLAHVPIRG